MVIVVMEVAELEMAAADAAVMVTVLPVGIAAGAVYIADLPLVVDAELKLPQAPVVVLPHVAVQLIG
jgi:hypothetical protein